MFFRTFYQNDECFSDYIRAWCCNEDKQFWFTIFKKGKWGGEGCFVLQRWNLLYLDVNIQIYLVILLCSRIHFLILNILLFRIIYSHSSVY